MDRFSGADNAAAEVPGDAGQVSASVGPNARAIDTLGPNEIRHISVGSQDAGELTKRLIAQGAKAAITPEGQLAIINPNGSTLVVDGSEMIVGQFIGRHDSLIASLNQDSARLSAVIRNIVSGGDGMQALRGVAPEFVPTEGRRPGELGEPGILAREQSSAMNADWSPKGLGQGISAIHALDPETRRWGRDDLKRGEAGEAGRTVETQTGTALSHLVGLGDEEIGHRNGEKLVSSDNSAFGAVEAGVGIGVDHLWLLGNIEYVRSSREEDDHNPFPVVSQAAKIWAPLEPVSAFSAVEDTVYGGALVDPSLLPLPITSRQVTMDPEFGAVTFGPDGRFTYAPAPGFSGFANFHYEFTDPRTGERLTGEVAITVMAVADPAAISGAAVTDEDVAIATPVAIDLNDPDGSEDIEQVVIAGLPSGAVLNWNTALAGSISAGPNGTFVVTGATTEIKAILQSLQVVPPHDFHGRITLDIAVTTIERNVPANLPGYLDRATVHHAYHIDVTAVADFVTSVGDDEVTLEDVAVHLNDLAVSYGDLTDGSEVHSVVIRGVDGAAKLQSSLGAEYAFTLASDGTKTYTLSPSDVGNVFFLPPPNGSGTYAGMTITAIATEGSNGDQETASAPIRVVVTPVADPLELTAPPQVTNEDTPVTFGDDIVIVVQDPLSQTLTEVVVSGFPSGTIISYTPVGGGTPVTLTLGAGGSVTFNGGTEAEIRAALATLTLTPPPHTDQNIALSITATTEDTGGVSHTQTVPMAIAVAAVADGPSVAASASGNEDQPINFPVTVSRIDVDGSETYEFAALTVPAGVTVIYPGTLPNGITVSVVGTTTTFVAGPATTAAQFEAFLATSLQVQAPADSDVNFNVSVRVGMIESVLSGGEVTLLRAEQTVVVPVAVHPVIDMPVVAGSSSVDEDASVVFGANIAISQNDKIDGSEAITSIALGNIPVGATVAFSAIGGAVVTTATAAGHVTYTISGGSEDDIRATVATFSLTPPLHSDANIPVSVTITKVDRTTTEGEALATSTGTHTHVIAVAAVADGPSVAASASGNEDQPINFPVTVSRIDVDGSETYEFAALTVPAGVTVIYPGTLPNGITVSVVGTTTTFVAGPATTAAQFEAFLATSLQVQAPADSDVNFNVSVRVGMIESVLSGGEVTLLRAEQTVVVPVAVHPVIDAPSISGTSTINEDGIVNVADQSTTAPVNFGANIAITNPDRSDGSERITQIVVSGLPVGATVSYTPVGGGAPVTYTVGAGTTSITLSGGSEAAIRAALSSMTLVPPLHSDADITLGIAVTKTDATGIESEAQVSQIFNGTHTITVAAVADIPTGSGSGAGLEDQNIAVSMVVGHPDTADGSETIKNVVIGGVPAGLTLTESSAGLGALTLNGDGTYTVTGPSNASINDVLANLTLVFAPGGARQHLDTDFSLTATVTTVESAVGATQNALPEASTTFSVPVTVTAVADGVTNSGTSTIVEDVARTIGAEIAYARIDNDGTEAVTSVTISGFSPGSTVSYTDMLGAPQTVSVGAGGLSLTFTGGTEAQIRAAIDTLNVTAPLHSDVNISLSVSVTTQDNDASSIINNFAHTVVVQAVADAPGVSADAIALNEDGATTLTIRPDRSVDADDSETLSVRITVPSDGSGAIGALSGTPPGGVTLTSLGGGVYSVEAAGASPAIRETLLDGFLNGGVTFTPRADWTGVLTGASGIRVDAVSTESANGGEVAPAGFGGPDGTSKTETVTTYIDVTIAPVNDLPVLANASTIVQENGGSTNPSDPDLVVPIGARLGLTIADTDGSQGLSMTLTGFPNNAQALAFGSSIPGVITSVDIPTGTVTISGTNANDVLTVMNSLTVTLADDRDQNFTVTINGTSTDSNGVTVVTDNFSLTHAVTVQAVADAPTVDVGALTKAAVNEDSGYISYPVTTALNDTDGSETYQSILVQFSTVGAGARPEIQFGVTAGVTFDTSIAGQVTLIGAAADINAAMASLQVRPGVDNGEDITVSVTATSVETTPAEDNNGATAGLGGGVAGPEISIPVAQTVQTFTIPVTPVPEIPTLTIPANANGAEDTKFALGAIVVASGSSDPDNSESRYFEIDVASYPSGTQFYNGAAVVGSIVTPGWLRVTEAQLATLSVQPAVNYSGTINLSVRGVVVDASPSGDVTTTTASQTLPVIVTPDADGITTPALSSVVEDIGAVAVGVDINAGVSLVDNATGTGNNVSAETISEIILDFRANNGTVTYAITPGSASGSAQIAFDAGTRAYTITSTIITGAADVGALSQANRAQAEADIRATVAGFTVTMGPSQSDVNGAVDVTVTTLDVNGGLANTQSNAFTHTIRVQAVADTPSLTVVDPGAVSEDGANIAITINPGNSADVDDSETLSVRITVPTDATGPVGTIVGSPPVGVTLVHQGNGVYLVTAVGASNAAREALLDSFLNGGGMEFDPRAGWAGSLTGTSGLRVDAISTEAATGTELAAGSFGGADGTSATETVTDYIDIVVSPVADAPTVKGNGVGLEDALIPVPMSVTLSDKDGSETYVVRLTAVVPPGTLIYGAGGTQILPDGGGIYTLSPADVSALAVRPPVNFSTALSGDIVLTAETVVTDTTSAGTTTTTLTTDIHVAVTGIADAPGTRTVNVVADEDEPIALGSAILASAGGDLSTLLVDNDGSEALSFVIGGLPQGVIPTSAVPGGVTYIGNGTWSVTAAALPTLELPPVPNFSGDAPYSGVTVRAVTQEIDGDDATSPQWPVTISINPVINSATVDGLTGWSMGVTQTEAASEGGAAISLASAANHAYVDNDGSEQVVSYTFNLSALIADAGIAARLDALRGAVSTLDDLVAGYIAGTYTYNSAAGTITVLAANIAGVSIASTLFVDSNDDFSIPVSALVRDTATIGGSPVFVTKSEAGSFNVNLVGTADTPTVFANSVAGNSGTPIAITLGGISTDQDVALGRVLSEDVYYVVSLLNPGTAPVLGFTDGAGNIVGLDNGDGSWILTPADLAGLHVMAPPGSNGTANMRVTSIAVENDGDTASNNTAFDVVVTSAGGTGGTPPLPPVIAIGSNSGNEDGSFQLNVTASPAPGDTSNPSVAVMISNLPAGTEVIGARYNPDTGRWVASAASVNSGLVQIVPPQDFSGTLNITIEAVATNASLQKATTGATIVPVDVDPVADGVAISAAPGVGVEDTAIALNLALGERDIDGNESIGGETYVRLSNGAALLGGYSVVLGGDPDATIDGTSLVGFYRVPTGDVGSLQILPASHWHGTVSVDVASYSVEPVDVTPDADNTNLDVATFSVTVAADADAPAVTAPVSVSGLEDTAISIPGLSAALVDTISANGAEVLSVKISGVPSGSRFSDGSNNGDGSWTIPASALSTLSITPPLNYSGTMTLSLTAIALELANGDEAQSSVAFNVVVSPKADAVEILAENVTVNATGTAALELNVRMADTTGLLAGENTEENIRISFTAVPTGVILTANAGGTLTNPASGTWVFTGTEAQANAIGAAVGSAVTAGNHTISLSAVTIDATDTLAVAVTDTFQLTIPQVLLGTAVANTLTGGAGTQLLFGLGGNDTLNGGADDDYMVGSTGNDIYVVSSALDAVVELAGEGTDTVQSALATYTLGANLENLTFTGTGSFAGTGNALTNTLTGAAGADSLDGQAGADTMIGLGGNDTYVVDNAGDVVTEAVGQGTDTVMTALSSYVLAANVEIATYTGSGSFTGTGNALANTLTGGASADTLIGGAGADTMTGGAGADTFDFNSGDLGAGVDGITDFTAGSGGDQLDIAGLLSGFNAGTSVLTEFVQVSQAFGNSTIRVDVNGGGDNFQDLVILQGVTGLDINVMRSNGNLIV